jgi:hypothetical protein
MARKHAELQVKGHTDLMLELNHVDYPEEFDSTYKGPKRVRGRPKKEQAM